MNDHDRHALGLHAEPAVRVSLATLDGGGAHEDPGGAISQQRADALLARIVWSGLTEPSDSIAGALIAAMGAGQALELLVRRTEAGRIVSMAAEVGVELPVERVQQASARWLERLDRSERLRDIDRGRAAGLRVVLPGDPLWPSALNDLGASAPILLWVRGEVARLSAPSLAVVGSRMATGYGSHVTAEIVNELCHTGFTIVSGAAYGIDAVAHRTALAAGAPTIAVLAGGADKVYPAGHDTLIKRIVEGGAVCSEVVPGTSPTRWRFLARNRLIAALSRGVLVTEAGVRSGTLNTAGHAAELGRPVGAVPGPITSTTSAGCHKLLREYNATPITSARDVCEMVGINDRLDDLLFDETEPVQTMLVNGEPAEIDRELPWRRRVLDALPLRGGRELTDIARRAGLSAQETRGVLAELELLGQVERRDPPDGAQTKWLLIR